MHAIVDFGQLLAGPVTPDERPSWKAKAPSSKRRRGVLEFLLRLTIWARMVGRGERS